MAKSKVSKNGYKNNQPQAKLIFVGEDLLRMKKVELFARENQMSFSTYSEEEWVTLEEIDQYIQDEEISQQTISLPVGQRTVVCMETLEEEVIKKALENTNGNMTQASLSLKIARATLYRKMKKHGLEVQKEREEELEQPVKVIKKAS